MPKSAGEWKRYYQETGQRAPRPTLLLALDRFDLEDKTGGELGQAIDLGCGSGRDTIEILQRGWRVLAIDRQSEAIKALHARDDLPADTDQRLETAISTFEEAQLPSADLINSGFALPGCAPDHFPKVWRRIIEALTPGGRFSGQLYGVNDSWAAPGGKGDGMTFLTRPQVDGYLAGLEIEMIEEEETDSVTPRGETKHWHIFHIVVRKI